MQNIGVCCDVNWDNFILIFNKFKKINNQHIRLNTIYGKTLEILNNCSIKNNITLVRHYSESLSKTVYNLLKICDCWLFFTNMIEYNTPLALIKEKCDEYNIKYIIISEYNRESDYYSFPNDDKLSFKKIVNNIDKINLEILPFNDNNYNELFNKYYNLPLLLIPEIKEKIKLAYSSIDKVKKERSIKLLYDKDEFKKEKAMNKSLKSYTQLQFNQNRLNYYKNIK